MNWHDYLYLVPVALGALALAYATYRLVPALSQPQDQPRRTRAEVGLLLAAIALGLTTLYTNYYLRRVCFGWWDVGSDTVEQYVPYYLNLLQSLKDGSLGFWNYHYGLGTSFMSYQSWTLDPFNLIVVPLCLIGGVDMLSLALVVAQSAKIVLAGLLFDHLLVHYCRTPLARVVGAALYAFCGYLLLWGQHYWLGGVCVICVALLVALEELMVRWTVPRFACVVLLSALSIIMSTYCGFMIMLFAATYAAVRVAHVSRCTSFGSYLRLYGRLALPATCGVLISCLTLVPYALLMLGESSRISSGGQVPLSVRALGYLKTFVPTSWVLPTLSRTLGNSLISSGEPIPPEVIPASSTLSTINVFEFVSLGLSCGAFVLLLQYVHWLVTEANTRTKVLAGIGIAFGLLYCFNTFLPALNNVFAEAKYRSSFVVCIVACLALAVGFEQRLVLGHPSRALLCLGGALTVAVEAWSLMVSVNGRLECLLFLAASVTLVVVLWISQRGDWRRIAVTLAAGILIGSSVVDGFFSTNRRAISSPEDFPLATEPNKASDTAAALAYLSEIDPTFYRVEKLDYFDWTSLDDCLVQNYATISSYNSTLDADIEEFYAKLWPDIYAGDTAYQQYRNSTNHPTLVSLLGVRYLLSYDPQELPWLEELASFGHIHVYRNRNEASLLTLRPTVVPESVVDALATPGEREAVVERAHVVPDEMVGSIETAVGTVDASTEPSALNAMSPSMPVAHLEGQTLRTEVSSPQACLACLALPYTAGWNVQVDGSAVETFRTNYGFVGFVLPAGSHVVEASFVPRGLLLACAIAGSGLLLAVVSCALLYRARRKQQ